MAEKTKLNAYINTQLADEFRKIARLSYGQIGLCLSAAMLQFLETASEDQVSYIKRVYEAEEEGKVDALIQAAHQARERGRDSGKKTPPAHGKFT
ncbi:MAG TPA: hypothetical protein VFE58_01800 [Tepidisphaeraceae bacterium]|jgi:hypothetical protein|nr:hypothetical protein [Tepidisphaeraceae bacterium]